MQQYFAIDNWGLLIAVLMVCILAFNILARVIGKYLERRLTSE